MINPTNLGTTPPQNIAEFFKQAEQTFEVTNCVKVHGLVAGK
jgi:hypothetical protein